MYLLTYMYVRSYTLCTDTGTPISDLGAVQSSPVHLRLYLYCRNRHYFGQILGHLHVSLILEQSRVSQYICTYIYCHYFAQILGHLSLISEQSRVAQYIRKTLARKTVGDRGSSGKPREREETDRGERGGGGRAVREPAAGNVAKVREGERERRERGREGDRQTDREETDGEQMTGGKKLHVRIDSNSKCINAVYTYIYMYVHCSYMYT